MCFVCWGKCESSSWNAGKPPARLSKGNKIHLPALLLIWIRSWMWAIVRPLGNQQIKCEAGDILAVNYVVISFMQPAMSWCHQCLMICTTAAIPPTTTRAVLYSSICLWLNGERCIKNEDNWNSNLWTDLCKHQEAEVGFSKQHENL